MARRKTTSSLRTLYDWSVQPECQVRTPFHTLVEKWKASEREMVNLRATPQHSSKWVPMKWKRESHLSNQCVPSTKPSVFTNESLTPNLEGPLADDRPCMNAFTRGDIFPADSGVGSTTDVPSKDASQQTSPATSSESIALYETLLSPKQDEDGTQSKKNINAKNMSYDAMRKYIYEAQMELTLQKQKLVAQKELMRKRYDRVRDPKNQLKFLSNCPSIHKLFNAKKEKSKRVSAR